jgi:parallel beta-helix repeat protein
MKATPETLLVLIAVTILLTLGYASASTIVKSGESIQAAIDAAKPGETIEVYSGTYQESLQIGKQIVLKGIDSGSGLPQVVTDRGSAITIKGSGVILEGIWAKSASGWTGDAGILVTSNSNILRNNMASGSGNTGILLQKCVNNTLSGNVAQSNGNEGILLKNCSRCLLTENQLKGNRYGIKMTGCYGTRVIGNTFANNKYNAIYLTNSQSNLIERNYASGSDAGLTMETCKDNIVRKNDFVGNDKGISVSYLDTGKDTKSSGKGVVISYNSMPSDDAVSSNNSIYQNNLTNRQNAYDTSLNYWDNGKLGNNYSDFNDPSEGCTGKKVCDSEHRIPGGSSVDEFPQAAPVQIKGRLTGVAGAVLQLFQTSFVPGGQLWVNYSSPTNKEAWAGIIDSGGKSESIFGQSILYLGQNITKDVALTAPDREGSFKLRMVDGNGSVILSLPFNVTVPGLNASPSSVGMCENIAVTYRGASGQKEDWIGMFRTGSSDAVGRQTLASRESGTVTFSMSQSGNVEFKMFSAGASVPLVASNPVEITAISKTKVIAEPSRVSPGGTVTVTYWGAPASGTGIIGMYGMTRPDKEALDKRGLGSASCGSFTWRLPSSAGQYDFRMFQSDITSYNQGAYVNLAQSNVVTVG